MRLLSWTFEMKVKAPQGAILTNNLSVLQSLHVAFCAHGDVGFSMKTKLHRWSLLCQGVFERLWKLSLGLFMVWPAKKGTIKNFCQQAYSRYHNPTNWSHVILIARDTKRYSSFTERCVCLPGLFPRNVILIVWLAVFLFFPVFNVFCVGLN